MNKPKVSCIIPTYKHLELLTACCDSIIKYTDLTNIEVICVANGCGNDGTREYVESLGDPFKLVWIEEAAGFTRATNFGVANSTGEIIILMNNDVTLLPQTKNQWIDYLCNPLKDNVGMTGNLKIWDTSVERNFLVGFLVAFPRHIWDKCGPFDAAAWSPGGGEDIEFCLKVEQLGYKIIQVPDEKNMVKDGLNVNRFPSFHPGEKTMMDEEHKEEWVKHVAYFRAKLANKYKLPPGYFYGMDIEEYRRLVEDVPVGGTIGELGCAYGRSICSVADIIKRKKLKVIVVDCFTGTKNEPGSWDTRNFRPEFENNLKRFGIFEQVIIHEGLTTDVVKEIPDEMFDEIFLDADHEYFAVKRDVEDWSPKLKDGGTFSGHDYFNWPGVSKAVNERWSNVRVYNSVWSKRI